MRCVYALFFSARVLASSWQVPGAGAGAGHNFQNPQWVPGKLFVDSARRISFIWEDYNFLIRFKRLDLNGLIQPCGALKRNNHLRGRIPAGFESAACCTTGRRSTVQYSVSTLQDYAFLALAVCSDRCGAVIYSTVQVFTVLSLLGLLH